MTGKKSQNTTKQPDNLSFCLFPFVNRILITCVYSMSV
jgi:hypothetical protein